MYQLAICRDFIAQHYLVGGDWGAENQRHSHHYRIEIRIEHDLLDNHGYLVDIVDLENALSAVIERFKDFTLNDLSEFEGLNPSLEHFARIIYEGLQSRLDFSEQKLTVKLWENERDWAAYRE
ncbi:MAG: 6-carboxytetrahydropterin synthase [Gammaproteobacteria bacterium]|uniref:6-pyruvoyl trahydropterin synthase family protein n=1 Tax=Methylotuvimicrobium sp. TaxID=2822413 RepID=UPI001D9AEEC6|nr:6-carboxytetrahydropterin synthase [Gammaproteobacteria bacterium]